VEYEVSVEISICLLISIVNILLCTFNIMYGQLSIPCTDNC